MAKSYEASGVNLEAGYEVVSRIKKHVSSTVRRGSMGNIGSFGGMFDLGELARSMTASARGSRPSGMPSCKAESTQAFTIGTAIG